MELKPDLLEAVFVVWLHASPRLSHGVRYIASVLVAQDTLPILQNSQVSQYLWCRANFVGAWSESRDLEFALLNSILKRSSRDQVGC